MSENKRVVNYFDLLKKNFPESRIANPDGAQVIKTVTELIKSRITHKDVPLEGNQWPNKSA